MSRFAFFILSLATLSACGGGGGGGSDGSSSDKSLKFSSPDESIVVQGHTTDMVYSTVRVSASGEADGLVYFGIVDESESMLNSAFINVTSDTEGFYELQFKPGYMIGDGESQTSLNLMFCYDENCEKHVKGSPLKVNVSYLVDLKERLSASDNDLILSSEIGNSEGENIIQKKANVSGPYIEQLFYKTIHEKSIATSFVETRENGVIDLDLQLKLPHILGEGRHQGEMSLHACYDEDCEYPVHGSPVIYSVDYAVKPATINDTSIAVNSSKRLPFNVLDTAYLQGLDVIAMTSSFPDNAVYIYDIQADRTDKFPLSGTPKVLTVDNSSKLGRIAILQGSYYEQQIDIIDFNKRDKSNSQVQSVFPSVAVQNLIVKNDTLLLVPDGNSEPLFRMSINTFEEQVYEGLGHDFSQNKIVMNYDADMAYTLSTSSPKRIVYTKLKENLDFDGEHHVYHDDYYKYGYFWLGKNHQFVYGGYGDIFSLKEPDEKIGTWIGGITNDESVTGKFIAFSDNGDQIAVTESNIVSNWQDFDFLSESEIKIINKEDKRLLNSISLSKLDNKFHHAKWLYYSSNNQLFAISQDASEPSLANTFITKVLK
ncbi:hypothetical protein [Motilimonas pumila]|uniref:Uncharacterized protein n=1 Tax=Motilimonas pumila TaxID=2303987 RepID=A0A418YF08_9GAMM|nr:hypothetical protein [Motilimonas pumila]RJG47743.1 hypothetical protein D1Z90_10090 [Motilimonas pumila]